jgi:hypothetical protein
MVVCLLSVSRAPIVSVVLPLPPENRLKGIRLNVYAERYQAFNKESLSQLTAAKGFMMWAI